jgi:hypothetical protein
VELTIKCHSQCEWHFLFYTSVLEIFFASSNRVAKSANGE